MSLKKGYIEMLENVLLETHMRCSRPVTFILEKDIIHNSILILLEKWKKSTEEGKSYGALPIDLSKAFDCLDYELLTAKLNAYGFNLTALRLIHNHLSNRKQRKKIDDNCSSWWEILFSVGQFYAHFFYIFLADLFFVVKDIDLDMAR